MSVKEKSIYTGSSWVIQPSPDLPDDLSNPFFRERFERDMKRYFNQAPKKETENEPI